MTKSRDEPKPGYNDGVDGYVALIAARLNERVMEVSSIVRLTLEEQIPELRGDARTIELLGASVEGNIDTILHALRHDIAVERITPPAAALEYARRLAQHGVPVVALVRAYRLGQRRLTELVFDELHNIEMEAMTRVAVIESVTTVLFAYIDWISQQVVAVYEEERERWLESQNSLRALRVRQVLAGRTIDTDTAIAAIRYPLRWHHVALVMWFPDSEADNDELTRLQRFVRDLGTAANCDASPLFVAADQTSGWAWLPYKSAPVDVTAEVRRFAVTRPDTPSIAIGAVGADVDGFRLSHSQALQARAIAVARGAAPATVVAATDPGLSIASLLGGNVAEVRDWVAKVLGPLATDSPNDARLRETLRVFLRTGSSHKAAAPELDLHANSVKYRVGRAVVRRGRPIEDDRLEVELALLICFWFGSAVLRRDPS